MMLSFNRGGLPSEDDLLAVEAHRLTADPAALSCIFARASCPSNERTILLFSQFDIGVDCSSTIFHVFPARFKTNEVWTRNVHSDLLQWDACPIRRSSVQVSRRGWECAVRVRCSFRSFSFILGSRRLSDGEAATMLKSVGRPSGPPTPRPSDQFVAETVPLD